MKKYELTTVSKQIEIKKGEFIDVFQIKALQDNIRIGVKAGQVGGFILDEDSLSQDGDCWVFPDSVVTHDVKISGNAVVRGESLLRNNVTLRGNCTIEDSHLAHDIIIDGNAHIIKSSLRFKCWIGGDVLVQESKICSMIMNEGKITNSTLMVKNKSFMRVEGKTTFLDVEMEIRGKDEAFIKKGGHFEMMKASKLNCFQCFEDITIVKTEFTGETKLRFGDKDSIAGEKSTLWGGRKKLQLENLNLRMKQSEVKNGVNLKGYMNVYDSQLKDVAQVVNETDYPLTLRKVKMDELASILKKDTVSCVLENQWLTMDNEYSC